MRLANSNYPHYLSNIATARQIDNARITSSPGSSIIAPLRDVDNDWLRLRSSSWPFFSARNYCRRGDIADMIYGFLIRTRFGNFEISRSSRLLFATQAQAGCVTEKRRGSLRSSRGDWLIFLSAGRPGSDGARRSEQRNFRKKFEFTSGKVTRGVSGTSAYAAAQKSARVFLLRVEFINFADADIN